MAQHPQPASIDPRGAVALALMAFASSLAVRGPRRSLRLLAISLAVASAAEALAIRGTRGLRHHSHPQLGELPLSLPLLWYAYVVPSYGLAQAAAGDGGTLQTSLLTALLGTATDLANDPYGLASGYWEWRDGGPYMPDLAGPNGVCGIPLANYVAWLLIMGGAAWLSEQGREPPEAANARAYRTPLLLFYWMLSSAGLGWAAAERRWRLLAIAGLAVLGGGGYSQGLFDAISRANAANILFVAAAGNGDRKGNGLSNDTTLRYPSSYDLPNVIAVAAIAKDGSLASFSNYGAKTVDLGAPGVGVYSTTAYNTYSSYSGTSMATPHVTGAVALYASTHPGATAAQIKNAILSSAVPTASLSGKTATGGRLDANAALLK